MLEWRQSGSVNSPSHTTSNQGFSTAQKLDKLGMRGSDTCELVFEDCEASRRGVGGVKGAKRKRRRSGDEGEGLCCGLVSTKHTRTHMHARTHAHKHTHTRTRGCSASTRIPPTPRGATRRSPQRTCWASPTRASRCSCQASTTSGWSLQSTHTHTHTHAHMHIHIHSCARSRTRAEDQAC